MSHDRTRTTKENLGQRFWSKVLIDPTGCWEWIGAKGFKGYGQIRFDGRIHMAHRVAYELDIGEIGLGMQIDHLCRNPGCVRPDHLEPVTQRENIMRGTGVSVAHAARTHCPKGHPYSPENTFYENLTNGRRGRRCRICNSERNHDRYLRRSEGTVTRRHRSTRIGQDA